MPLGIQQNNSFVHMTLDLWNDKVFYQEKEFPAGHFAASILNITDEELTELIQRGGAPTFYLPTVIQGRDEEVTLAFPVLRQQILSLAEILFRYPPFCYLDREREREQLTRLFSDSALPLIRVRGSEAQQKFLMLCAAITRVPLAICHFVTAGRFFELDYLRRLKKRDETHFAVPPMTVSTASCSGTRCGSCRAWMWSGSLFPRSWRPPMCWPAVPKARRRWCSSTG